MERIVPDRNRMNLHTYPSGEASASAAGAAGSSGRSRADTLRRLDQLSRVLDEAYRVPGTSIRFGWDSLLGLVPIAGDVASAALSTYLVYEAHRLGVPRRIIARMAGNIALDATVGAIPLIGDIADAFLRSNRRNVALLRRHLESQDQ